MRWDNSETPDFASSARSDGSPNYSETLDLVARDGTVLKRYTKSADGALSESSVSVTPAVSRVVRGTIDTALSGTPAILRFGDLSITTVASGEGIPDDDDGTELIPYLAANASSIPADNVADDTGGVFTITFHPGAAANDIIISSADEALTFVEVTAGADVVSSLVAASSGGATLAIEEATGEIDGNNDTFTFSGNVVAVFRNGVEETTLGTIDGEEFVFDTPPPSDGSPRVTGLVEQ